MCTFIHLEENVRRCRWWKHSLENRWKQVFPAAAVGCQGALVAIVCRCTVFMWWRLKKKNIFSVWTWIYPWAAESVEMSGNINPTHTHTRLYSTLWYTCEQNHCLDRTLSFRLLFHTSRLDSLHSFSLQGVGGLVLIGRFLFSQPHIFNSLF